MSAEALVVSLMEALLLGLAVVGALAVAPRTALAAARSVFLALLIPAVWVMLRPPLPAVRTSEWNWLQLRLALGQLPVLILPLLRVLARLPSGQRRAAAGLGAGPVATLRLVWLPQLGPPLILGLTLAILLDLAALVLP